MSASASANLSSVRSISAAWERGDYSSVEWAHPDIEFVIADGPTAGRWTGIAGMEDGSRDFLGAWEEHHIVVKELREVDDERVLMLVRVVARGGQDERTGARADA